MFSAPLRTRREMLAVLSAGLGGSLLRSPPAWAAPFVVGVGQAGDVYTMTRRAVDACQEWPASTIAGRVVLIKPNLVGGSPASTGVTTDPEVVRALVDLSLEADAASVLIIEGGNPIAPFGRCGYDFFATYAPGRVSLVDLNFKPHVFAAIPGGGLAFRSLVLPALLLNPDVFFISAAKLKTHREVGATLSVKNLFGLPPVRFYFRRGAPGYAPRYSLHDRGIHQVIVDLLSVRPIDFAVVDGGVAMEGDGPTQGIPVAMGLALAGRNAVAVDRAALSLMAIGQEKIQHLAYASLLGLGPFDHVQLVGDVPAPRPFLQPAIPPPVWFPKATPASFAPAAGHQTRLAFLLPQPAEFQVEIIKVSENDPRVTVLRTLQPWTSSAAGIVSTSWDGRGDNGTILPPGFYRVRVQTRFSSADELVGAATGGVSIT